MSATTEVAIVGAGAAGIMTAIACARVAPATRIVCLDGAAHLGAKILVSGGGRCNVTNVHVDERDYWGGPARVVRRVLRAFPASRTVDFFRGIGVPLHEEEYGKLFPDSHQARSVLEALVAEARRLGVTIATGWRVTGIRRLGDCFELTRADGTTLVAAAVVLATGGRSLPKSGSDGAGYQLASSLGHRIVATSPALVPLVLGGEVQRALAGVSHPAGITVRVDGAVVARLSGPLLWTHVGISGPVALDTSRHWLRGRLDGHAVTTELSVCPDETFESCEAWLLAQQGERPRASVNGVLGARLPAALAQVVACVAAVDGATTMAHLDKEARRRLVRACVAMPLEVRDSRGYTYAEATAGGVSLEDIDPATMASRLCPGLYLVGEVLDVDGRLGGFNFQWAWSSGWVAGQALARRFSAAPPPDPPCTAPP